MPKLYFDTSFLIYAVRFKIDFLEEISIAVGRIEAVVPSTLLNELAAVKGRGGKFAQFARIAEAFLRQRLAAGEIKVIKAECGVDSFVLHNAKRGDIVCTNDKRLRKSLKEKGIKTAITRGKRILIS